MVSDWIWEADKNSVYTYSSPKILDILGYTPEEIIGKTPFDLMPAEEAKRVTVLQRYSATLHNNKNPLIILRMLTNIKMVLSYGFPSMHIILNMKTTIFLALNIWLEI